MFSAFFIPDFPLQAALHGRGPSANSPAAVCGSDDGPARIMARTAAAARAGVDLGMTPTQGLARCGRLELLDRSLENESLLQSRLLDAAESLTPDFESTAPGLCTVDLGATRAAVSLHAGEPAAADRFAADAIAALRSAGLGGTDVRIGAADNPDLAALAARRTTAADPFRAVAGGGRAACAFLDALPIEAAGPSRESCDLLHLWGVRTLGDLAALPRDELVERLGPEGGALRDCAAGGKPRPLRLVRPPRSFAAQLDLEHPIESLEPLLFLIRRLLETLVARLDAVWLVAAELKLDLAFEDGARARESLRIPDPSRDVDLLFRIIHTRLDGFTADAPVTELALDLVPARPLAQQLSLFDPSLRDPNRFAETLARLEAVLGADKVGTPEILDSFRPDAIRLRPFAERRPNSSARPANARHAQLDVGPPIRRFRPPRPVKVECHPSPPHLPVKLASLDPDLDIAGTIRELRGPWLHSGQWWDPHTAWSRQEWDAVLESGAVIRLARERRRPDTWLAEGIC